LVHTPTLQSLLSDVQFFGVLTQTPAEQTSSVQALLSVQVAVLLSPCWHPTEGLHVSLVHGLPSSHATGTLIGSCTHAPVLGVQVSVVHWFASLQSLLDRNTHVPWKQTSFVQRLPSSHAVLSAAFRYRQAVPPGQVTPSGLSHVPGVVHATAQHVPPTQ
jgi:hypothetical protein